ncbi:MAG: hypothetical protein JW722_00290 [Demequinaceae bacterium]|nr:hypothetical protein [Demequinaceae bacterium]
MDPGITPSISPSDTGPLGEPIALTYADRYRAGGWKGRMYGEDYYGSGCSPSSATTLPDGEWFGYIMRWGAASIDFDLACLGYGYTVTNDNSRVRTLSMSEDAIYVFDYGSLEDWPNPYPFGFSFGNVVEARATIGLPQTSNAVWVFLNDGVVTQVEAWVGDTDTELLKEGLPWVPWGPESEPDASHPFHPEISGLPDDISWNYFPPAGSWQTSGSLEPDCPSRAPEVLPDGVYIGSIWQTSPTEVAFHPTSVVVADYPESVCYNEAGSWTVPAAADAQYLSQQSPIGALSLRAVLNLPQEIRPQWQRHYFVYINGGEITYIHGEWQA